MTERERAIAFNREICNALRAVYHELNPGQRQKLLKAEAVCSIFERYRVLEEDENNG